MSFRTRLTGFFVVIVVVPMLAVGVLVFRLIGDSATAKGEARASGLAAAAASVYNGAVERAKVAAEQVARDPTLSTDLIRGSARAARARLATLVTQGGLTRATLTIGSRRVADVGDRTGIAPGIATISVAGGSSGASIAVSELTADEYARELVSRGVGVVVAQGGTTLASTIAAASGQKLPRNSTIRLGGVEYRTVAHTFKGFGGAPITVTILSDLSITSSSVTETRLLASVFIAAFLVLAFSFSVLASRALQGQLDRFLQAARRLAGGNFSAPVPIEGRDEFAALGDEFNNMSRQLEHRLYELGQERARLRESIRRIGETFASNLDRPALLKLALTTAVDAARADCGRASVRTSADAALAETARVGSFEGLEEGIFGAETAALRGADVGVFTSGETSVASVRLGPLKPGERAHGLITIARTGQPFSPDDDEVLRSLASQATLALENVELHHQIQRQAVTDELTGLANHGHFQDLLSLEIEQVRRYQHSVGLIMLDVDNFKLVNDTYGHQQGDVVLKYVAQAVRENSRDADAPARYGGEEMAVILPHTDLVGAHAIAERVRTAIEGLQIPRLDGSGFLQITASLGVAASTTGDKDALISGADNALYTAKRSGKNRTVQATASTANVVAPR
jgi:diguanylate cyclase (GGDEF)-like protein